ncbi:MAG TPA: DUF4932 domain-containing protein [Tenuifilaceae bacterium]|nr:DUF4932 domain-containing protein [Tenuifilaceae bacterium]HPI44207.1 DUF4932 domain-containing protein [Tenuifilaceae bacterium]
MQKVWLFLILTTTTYLTYSQNNKLTPVVDERTELLGIVFRLAEADEYINNTLPSYSKEINEYFANFKNHNVVKFAEKLRAKRGVSYNAVMSMAINIEITDSIRFLPNASIDNLDSRWGTKNAKTFLIYLNQFYRESNFHQFFQNHSAIYSIATENFNHLLKELDTRWFEDFYGVKTSEEPNIIVSLTNIGNYGPKITYNNGSENIYAIMGIWEIDSLGNPIFSKSVLSVLVHELNHSFCNPLIDKYYHYFQKEVKQLYNLNPSLFKAQAYGDSKTVMYEMLVRACTIKYFQQKKVGSPKIKLLIADERTNGFLWIDRMIDWLDVYDMSRDKYSTLSSFMPEIAKNIKELSLEQIKKDYESCFVTKIISSNIPNGATNVNSSTNFIVVTFNSPMNINNNGASWGKKGKKYYPKREDNRKAFWNKETKMEWNFPVNLKPNSTYSISFPAEFFVDENGYPMKETYYLDFKTGN